MAAGTIAAMDRCMAATIEYTSLRKAFGKSILDNQYVHYKLAELQTEVWSEIHEDLSIWIITYCLLKPTCCKPTGYKHILLQTYLTQVAVA